MLVLVVLFLANCLICSCTSSSEVRYSTKSTESFKDGSFNLIHTVVLPSGDTVLYPPRRVFWQEIEFVSGVLLQSFGGLERQIDYLVSD